MFDVDYDPSANRIHIACRGFWTVEKVWALAAAIGAKAIEVRAVRDDFDVLIDALAFPVQSNEVAEMMTNVMLGGMAQTQGKVAIVVASHLNRLQAERTIAHPRIEFFMALAEARAWLAATD